MTLKKMGFFLLVLGIIGVIFSFMGDILPGGTHGIQSAQILGIEISILLALLGGWAILSATDESIDLAQRILQSIRRVLDLPVFAWVLIGFLIAFALFVISPMFLNPTLRMIYFTRYIPDTSPIGNDLIAILDLMQGWFIEGQSPYVLQFYPPFTYVFFAPLLLVQDYPTLYKYFTIFSLLSFCFLTFILPIKISGMKNIPIILLLFITGLSSYGFQFELERGQYNVFTLLLCLWAIYIFHRQPKYRIFAYLLFSIAVQLKIYPAIFILMFVDDWKNWKRTLLRFTGIALFNVLLLLIMGTRIFLDFLHSVTAQLDAPGWTWNGNHSMNAFVYNLTKDGFGIISSSTVEMLRQNSELIETLLLMVFIVCLAITIWIAYQRDKVGLDPYLLLTCTIGGLIIPISNDYTLSILAAPLAVFLSAIPQIRNLSQQFICILSTLAISFAYTSTLIPFKYKAYYLSNAFPALFLILIFATILNLIRYRHGKTATPDDP